MKYSFVAILFCVYSFSYAQQAELKRLKDRAQNVTIVRDNWGIPHIYAKTDADVVFGLLYAQCEDDFARVEWNYIDALGRTAEVEGETLLYNDLRSRLFHDSTRAKQLYHESKPEMKKLMDAFADGVNYYLLTHSETKPKLLHKFHSWYPLLFSEGSIGGDLTNINIGDLRAFYENERKPEMEIEEPAEPKEPKEPKGSNGFAIAPSHTQNGYPLLLINPHTSFYFRSEVQCVSEEGLNAYGAVTWGQFFVYQGFNNNCGWMHTSTYADAVDEFLETVSRKGDRFYYKHDKKWKEIKETSVSIRYKTSEGMKDKDFAVYRTHHGPVIAEVDGKWKTIAMMDDPVHALEQSFMRTKATDYDSYKKVMELMGNSSNNTVFADTKGNIAYWHGNFIPKRDPTIAWQVPVDGATNDWHGLHSIDEIIQIKNPANGWIQNCNSTPFTAAGESSPKRDGENYPQYMAPDGQNYRAINADRVLRRESKFTLDKLIAAAYDPALTAFDKLAPALIEAYETSATAEQKQKLKDPIAIVKSWNKQYGVSSVGTTLAISWARKLEAITRIAPKDQADHKGDQVWFIDMMIANNSKEDKLKAFENALIDLEKDYGTWNIGWGEMNRFQRPLGEIPNQTFDDSRSSFPVASAPSIYGSLAAFGSRKYPGLKKWYGGVGNSFVAVVEFGPRIKAKSLVTGGSSADQNSKHFNDQSEMYSKGKFKDVLFYKEDVEKHTERTYHPGE